MTEIFFARDSIGLMINAFIITITASLLTPFPIYVLDVPSRVFCFRCPDVGFEVGIERITFDVKNTPA